MRFFRRNKVRVFTDGALRQKKQITGLAAIVWNEQGQITHWWCQRAGPLTNNEAEYAAVIFALEQLRRIRPSEIAVFSDSRIVVDQMCGRASAKAPGLQKACIQLRALVFEFERVTFQHIPRERNRLADALANDVVDGFC